MRGWEILVVDDGSRFPLHVWRYLTGCLGFGIGEVGLDGSRELPSRKESEPWISDQPVYTEDGRHRLWWVSADGNTLAKLGTIVSKLDAGSRVYALLDIHGKPGYRAREAYVELEMQAKRAKVDCKVDLVSAYHSGHRLSVGTGQPFPVLPKSRETLRGMIRELGVRQQVAKNSPGVRHILVTGAGFELKGARGGFGMPPTREILREMGAPFKMEGPLDPNTGEPDLSCFPLPRHGLWESSGYSAVLRQLALKEELDSYWDYLLERELENQAGAQVWLLGEQARGENKAQALFQERRLREAYRMSLLRHDWGFMNQSLDATQMPLHAWLTTNYTRFADRAIDLYGDAGQEELGDWRIISTAAEARTLTREGVGTKGQKSRYLFKLHGDIAHLQTMAIAGHDKDRFSPLSMPVEDIYEVYATAERFLVESLPKAEPSLIIWHIVGHGLQDWRLCDLLARVWCQTRFEHLFVIVNPNEHDPHKFLRERLEREKKAGRSVGEKAIHSCPLKGGEYMARLLQLLRGEDERLPEIRQAAKFRQWCDAATKMGKNKDLL